MVGHAASGTAPQASPRVPAGFGFHLLPQEILWYGKRGTSAQRVQGGGGPSAMCGTTASAAAAVSDVSDAALAAQLQMEEQEAAYGVLLKNAQRFDCAPEAPRFRKRKKCNAPDAD